MLIPTAEESYKKGLQALTVGRRREAMALFDAAIELARRYGAQRPQPRYLSFYGLCLALETNNVHEALKFCREAALLEGFNPDIRCNLGRVLMRAGRRKEAYRNFARGLRLESGHRGIQRALKMMGIRRRPALPFLSRRNPLNVLLGRLRLAA